MGLRDQGIGARRQNREPWVRSRNLRELQQTAEKDKPIVFGVEPDRLTTSRPLIEPVGDNRTPV